MDRSAIFVDAGYLLAAGGRLTCGTTSRSAFKCDYAALSTRISEWVANHNGGLLHPLRTYWYDGAIKAIPTKDHEKIGGLPYVKVRLGRLIHGEQKGVDALIYRDLMTLARERAIACAYLLSGDEDLREGVVAAQDMGVQVVLLGIPSSRSNQSAALIREADEHVVLPKEHWEPYFSTPAAAPSDDDGPKEDAADKEAVVTPTLAAAQTAGRAFAVEWVKNASADELNELVEKSPKIPSELDISLIVDAESTLGSLRERQDLKVGLRAAFWAEIKEAKKTQSLGS